MDGKRTSVYLTPDLVADVKASGLGLAALIRLGLSLVPETRAPARRRTGAGFYANSPVLSARPTVADRAAPAGTGFLSAPAVTEPCDHPRGARDRKNPSRCRCGALNLPVKS